MTNAPCVVGVGIYLNDIDEHITIANIKNMLHQLPDIENMMSHIKMPEKEINDVLTKHYSKERADLYRQIWQTLNMLMPDKIRSCDEHNYFLAPYMLMSLGIYTKEGVTLSFVKFGDMSDKEIAMMFISRMPWEYTPEEKQLSAKQLIMVFRKWLNYLNVADYVIPQMICGWTDTKK